ncbi:hypothetical protein Bhyg_12207, partial [Pseudolycoriella hygida]
MDVNDLPNISGFDYDDLFEDIIKIDDLTEPEGAEDDDGKENPNPSAKAKRHQFKKISDFMEEHRGTSIGKKKFSELWAKLTCELNSDGPPTFTESQWRFKWSQHKYNKKRKLTPNAAEIGERSNQEQQSQSIVSSDPVQKIELTTHETGSSIREISDKLTVVIEKQDAILEALQRGNNLLQK